MEIDQVKSNVKKMLSKGATEQEVDQYLSYKGVTAEQLRAHKNQTQQEKGMLEGALDTVGDVAHTVGEYSGLNAVGKFAKDAYVGKQDPQYQNLEGFSGSGINDMGIQSQIARGKVSTITDKGFAGVIKNALGDRLVNTTKDKHGQEIISYKNDDGEIVQKYINKPGLDYQDIDRVAESAVPFVFGGGLAGSMAKGLGLAGRAIVQGGTAAGIDGVLQNQAQKDGSGEDYSVGRTALAGLGGAGGEVAGTILTKLFNGRGLVDKTTGKLTEKGRAWAKANRVDPDSLSDQTTEYLRQNIGKATDPEELSVQVRTGEFSIPTSKAQRTRSRTDAYTEKQMFDGLRGRDAEKAMRNFKDQQGDAIEGAAFKVIPDEIAPDAAGLEKVTLGDDIKGGLNRVHKELKGDEAKMWSKIGPMYPKEGAFKSLPDIVNARVQKAGISPVAGLTDASNDMTKIMQRFMTGDLKSESMGVLTKRANDNLAHKKGTVGHFLDGYERKENGIPRWDVIADYNDYRLKHGFDELELTKAEQAFRDAGLPGYKQAMRVRLDLDTPSSLNSLAGTGLDGSRQLSIDEARRLLLSKKNAADPGSPDARLANNLYEGFNEWIDDAAEKALIQSDDIASYAALKDARSFTRKIHQIFAPTDSSKKLTPAARKLRKIMETSDSPEGVISSIFGNGSAKSQLPDGSVQTLKHLKNTLLTFGEKKTFDSVKMAYWTRLVQDKNGKVLSAAKIRTNLDTAFTQQKSAIDIMFNKKEQGLIKRFKIAMNDLNVPDPNPSGTAAGVGHLLKSVAKQGLQTQSKRELFSKHNVLMSRIYSMLAKHIDAPIFNPGRALARRQTGQQITKRSKNLVNNSGGVGAVGMNTGSNIEE